MVGMRGVVAFGLVAVLASASGCTKDKAGDTARGKRGISAETAIKMVQAYQDNNIDAVYGLIRPNAKEDIKNKCAEQNAAVQAGLRESKVKECIDNELNIDRLRCDYANSLELIGKASAIDFKDGKLITKSATYTYLESKVTPDAYSAVSPNGGITKYSKYSQLFKAVYSRDAADGPVLQKGLKVSELIFSIDTSDQPGDYSFAFSVIRESIK